MAKKKTAGPDSTTGTTPAAAPRRRSATPKRSDAQNLSGGNGHGNGSSAPSPEQIAEAAYQRYLQRGGQHGRDFDDWVEAERELRQRTQS